MGVELLTERHAAQIAGVLGCWDRMLIFGTPPKICFAGGMTSFLYERKIRVFDYPKFAEPFRNRIRENAERLAAESGIEIEFIRKRNFRKEDRVKEILAKRGEQAGLSAFSPPWSPARPTSPGTTSRPARRIWCRTTASVCITTSTSWTTIWASAMCVYRRGCRAGCRSAATDNWLAGQLTKLGIGYRMADNAFSHIADWPRAQRISNGWEAKRIHARLDEFARRCCPIYRDFATGYHWSVDQCEYATDIIFRKQEDLRAIYENLARTAIHTVKPDNIATFLGRKLSPRFEGEMGNRFNIRIEGTRIKHTMAPVSLKLYDKSGLILRIETTVNDPTFFKHYREVEHRDGSREIKWASMQKTIYSLPALRELLEAANRRYLEFLSALADPRAGRNKLDKLSQTVEQEGRRYSGFNLFDPDDENLLCAIVRGEFNLSGLQNKTLRRHLPEFSSGQVSRLLKRLRTHGLVKRVGRTYRYYVTAFGKQVVATALKLRELVIIPQLACGLAQ